MKILIIRFSSMGDIVLTTPVIRLLRKKFPESEIHFCTKMAFKHLIESNSFIDKIYTLEDSLFLLIGQLRSEDYTYVIDLHKNIRSLIISIFLWKKTMRIRKYALQRYLYIQWKWDFLPKKRISDRFIDVLKTLEVYDDGQGLDYFIDKNYSLDTLPHTHKDGFIAMVIGGNYYTKKLPLDKIIELCKSISYPIILIGGKEEKSTGDLVAKNVGIEKVWNRCGAVSVNESADIIKKSKLVITNDTGMMHIASAFQKDIFVFWGGTSPKLGFEPYYGFANRNKSKNFIVSDLSCQPCSKFGTHNCPKKHFACMNLQNIEAVVKETVLVLEKKCNFTQN
ncbi:MAG: glycosyltransferase family 9 protein [Chitinophagaceae bacterium]|nr:glycosyltransferase family 9 protein [Chitinophagaceae bacterium]